VPYVSPYGAAAKQPGRSKGYVSPYGAGANSPAPESPPGAAKPNRLGELFSTIEHNPQARAFGSGVSKVVDLLSRPGEATAAAIAGRGGHAALQAFLHSETPQQNQSDLDTIISKYDSNDPLKNVIPQGVKRFAVGMETDPTTYMGGTGALKHVGMKVTENALPLAIKAALGVGKVAEKASPEAGHVARDVGGGLAKAYDFVTYGGGVKRKLATKMPADQGATTFARMNAAKNAGLSEAQDLENELGARFKGLVKGLSPSDEHALYRAVNSGALYKLPKALREKAQAFGDLTDTVAHLMGTNDLRAQLASHGFRVPEWAQRFDTGARGLMKPAQYRKNYLPLQHDLTPSQAAAQQFTDSLVRKFGIQRGSQAVLSGKDPFLKPRAEGLALADNEMQRDVIGRRFRAASKAFATKPAQQRIAAALGVKSWKQVPADMQSFLERESTIEPGGVARAVKKTVDLPKQALFYLPFRHMGNISFLQGAHYPEALPGTFSTFAQLMKNPGAAHQILGEAIKAGSVGVPSIDRSTGFADVLDKIPFAGKALAAPYRASSKALWAFDDAAKKAATDSAAADYMAKGLDRETAYARAGKDVLDRLVGYGNRSDLTKALAYIAPFATWRSKLPGSVARALTEHPERVLAAERASPMLTGGQVQSNMHDAKGKPLGVGMYNPLSDTFQLVDDPWKYGRSTLSFPYQALSSLLDVHSGKPHGYPHYMTYGKDPLRWLLQGALGPFAQPVGAGVFPSQGMSDLVGSQTGIRLERVHP
jgi:hypothetical protein